jgi:hypothetical protein
MRVLITEHKYYNMIEKYILDGYPMVKNVKFITKKTHLASGPNSRGENIIDKNVIIVELISSQMEHSPNWTMKDIGHDVNNMFGLDINKYGSDWDIDYEIVNLVEK